MSAAWDEYGLNFMDTAEICEPSCGSVPASRCGPRSPAPVVSQARAALPAHTTAEALPRTCPAPARRPGAAGGGDAGAHGAVHWQLAQGAQAGGRGACHQGGRPLLLKHG